MILPGEIDRIAIDRKVRNTQIQKDYVITWVLWGISQVEFLYDNLLFKGGTCLKKIYFDDYRYSEDLDFTLENDEISNEDILSAFEELFELVYDESRIKVEIEEGTFEELESGSVRFKLQYTGTHSTDSIKVDITRGEKIICGTEDVNVLKGYSDLEEEDAFAIKAYTLEEVLIEKMAALMGRSIPRDLYDFDYLIEEEGMDLHDVYIEFMTKAENKGHNPKDLLDVVNGTKHIYQRDWETSLAKQMPKEDLPEFKELWRKAIGNIKDVMKMMEN